MVTGLSASSHRIHLQPAYVLHHRPYRDTSRILELFTRDHGRLTVFARGARGGGGKSTSFVSMLQPFNRLLVSWSGRGEAGTLSAAEFDGVMTALPPERLVSGFYLNELLMKLFARHDSHPDVFSLYDATVCALKGSSEPLRTLRIFEKRLLDAIGYGLVLDREAAGGREIDPGGIYHYRLEQGAVRTDGVADGALTFSGVALLSLAREQLDDASTCADARRLLRAAFDRVLEGRELNSRAVMEALRRRK